MIATASTRALALALLAASSLPLAAQQTAPVPGAGPGGVRRPATPLNGTPGRYALPGHTQDSQSASHPTTKPVDPATITTGPTGAYGPPVSAASQPAQPPQVAFDGGLLSIRAENSSLNQILTGISTRTGIHVDGSVAEERVYGNFGPGSPAEVISRLLEGSPYNMILVGGSAGAQPTQLILTHRGPALANTNRIAQPARVVQAQDDEPDPDPEPDPPAPQNNPPAGPGFQDPNQQAPTGLRTPQQIFNQLQQQRQQQPQQDQITPQ